MAMEYLSSCKEEEPITMEPISQSLSPSLS